MSTNKESIDIVSQKIKELRKVFPEAFAENKVDFDILKLSLGDNSVSTDDRYGVNWAGRKEAFKMIQVTSKGTLAPLKDQSLGFETSENLVIEGDNLEVLKLLQKSYFEKIKMVYIDPPYNTGKDFVFRDNYRDSIGSYLEQTGQSENGIKLTTNVETNGRFHSDWMSMMYPRLFLARNLLRQDGLIFVSIDDNEVHNLRFIMNEIFGEENFISEIVWHSKYTVANDTKYLSQQHEYILLFAKNKELIEKLRLPRTEEMNERYTNPDNDPRGPWKPNPLHAKSGKGESYTYTFKNGMSWKAPAGTYPRFSVKTLKRLEEEGRIWFGRNGDSAPSTKTFLNELADSRVSGDLWSFEEVGHTHLSNEELAELLGKGIFDNPKPTKLIIKMLQLATGVNSNDIVLDFFAGSGTTGQAVLDLNKEDTGNRRFILVQLPEIAQRGSYKKITQITIDRLKKYIETNHINDGFKFFSLTRSNYRIWQHDTSTVKELASKLELFRSPLISGYKRMDLVYECIIKEGLKLNSQIQQMNLQTNEVMKVFDKASQFFLCLDSEISDDTLANLPLSKNVKFICLDSALNDSQKVNLAIQCELKTI